MVARLLVLAIRRFIGGPGRSWVFTSLGLLALRLIRSTTGRRELVDTGSLKPGDKLVIEALPVTHKQQLRDEKRSVRRAKAERKQAKRAKRAARRQSVGTS